MKLMVFSQRRRHADVCKQRAIVLFDDATKIHASHSKTHERHTVTKWVYSFGAGKAEGEGSWRALLGGKGSGLAEMSRIGLPVPPGFTITTEVCTYYYGNKKSYPKVLDAEVKAAVAKVEKIMGTKFGDKAKMPMLVSVRSGARDSMPGMMDTILNLGLNDETVVTLARATKNERFAWDCYRRFIQMYGDVVMGVQKRADEDHEPFEVVIHALKHERYHTEIDDPKLTVADLQEMVVRFKKLIKERTGSNFRRISGSNFGARSVRCSFLDERPRDCLSPQVQHSLRVGHRGERASDGLRQHWRQVGIRRRIYARPGYGRKSFLRRIFDQRARRRCRRRRAHSRTVANLKNYMPAASKSWKAFAQSSRNTLGCPGLRVHDSREQSLHVADAQRQTDRPRRRSLRRRHGKRKTHRLETAIRRVPADQLDQVLAPVFDRKAVAAAKIIAKGLLQVQARRRAVCI